MKDIFVNTYKLTLAQEESTKTGGDVKEIYLRMGGLVKTIEDAPIAVEASKKTRKRK